MSVVDFLLFFIGEYLVGVGNFGEFFGGSFGLVFVGVEFEGFGTVGFFDFFLGGLAVDAEDSVKVFGGVDGG